MNPRILVPVILLAALVIAVPGEARAQSSVTVDLAPYIGFGTDVPNQVADPGSMSVGALGHIVINLKDRLSLIANPDLEYYLTDSEATAYQFDANLLLSVGSYRTLFNPYVGIGLAVTVVSGDDPQSHLVGGTDLGFNLLAGSAFGAGTFRPFFQVRYTMPDQGLYLDDQLEPGAAGFGFKGGILFKVKE